MIVSPTRLVVGTIASVLVVVPIRWVFYLPIVLAVVLAVACAVDWWRHER